METEAVDCSESAALARVRLDTGQARIEVRGMLSPTVTIAQIFSALAEAGITVDLVIQNGGDVGTQAVSFTLLEAERCTATSVIEKLLETIGDGRVVRNERIARVSVAGTGLKSHSVIAVTFFEALAKAEINIEMIATSEMVIAVVVAWADAERAFDATCAAFEFPNDEAAQLPDRTFTD